jgi:hypothetical protein
MNEHEDEKHPRQSKPFDERDLPPELQVDWPRPTRPPRVEDFIKDMNEVSILPRFRF